MFHLAVIKELVEILDFETLEAVKGDRGLVQVLLIHVLVEKHAPLEIVLGEVLEGKVSVFEGAHEEVVFSIQNFTLDRHVDRSVDGISGDHKGENVSLVDFPDGLRRICLDFVLEQYQRKEGQAHLLFPEGLIHFRLLEEFVGEGNHSQSFECKSLEDMIEIVRNCVLLTLVDHELGRSFNQQKSSSSVPGHDTHHLSLIVEVVLTKNEVGRVDTGDLDLRLEFKHSLQVFALFQLELRHAEEDFVQLIARELFVSPYQGIGQTKKECHHFPILWLLDVDGLANGILGELVAFDKTEETDFGVGQSASLVETQIVNPGAFIDFLDVHG